VRARGHARDHAWRHDEIGSGGETALSARKVEHRAGANSSRVPQARAQFRDQLHCARCSQGQLDAGESGLYQAVDGEARFLGRAEAQHRHHALRRKARAHFLCTQSAHLCVPLLGHTEGQSGQIASLGIGGRSLPRRPSFTSLS